MMLAVFAEFEHATIVDRVTAGIDGAPRKAAGPPDGHRSATAVTSRSTSSPTAGQPRS